MNYLPKKKYQGIIFDLDGTLLNTLEDLADSMNLVLSQLGFPTHPIPSYRFFVGDGMETLAERALPETAQNSTAINQCVKLMKEIYGQHWKDKTRPYNDILPLLSELRDKRIVLGVVSNKPHASAVMVTTHFFSEKIFTVILGARENIPKKPDPIGALEAAALMGLIPERIIFVGDTGTDMRTAVGAGMFPVGVNWGFRHEKELIVNGCQKIIANPLELLTFL